MYKVILNEGEYKLPSGWEEVTFDQLIKLKKLNFETSNGNILATSMMAAALMNCDYKQIMKLNSEEFMGIAEATKWVYQFNIKEEFKNEFEFGGVKYRIIEDFNNLSIGEMASIEQYIMEDAEKNSDKILAIFIREVGEDDKVTEFNPDTLLARADVLRMNLTIPQIHGINSFFLGGGKGYIANMLDSSQNKKPSTLKITKIE